MNASKKRTQLAILSVSTALSALLSGNAMAQTVTYHGLGGPAVDINFQHNPPPELTYCRDRYRSDGYKLDACTRGMSESRRMAERYAGGWGRTQGYLRGYSWGLYKMAGIFENDAREIAQGRAGLDAIGHTMEAGLEAGRRDGNTQGSSRGRSEVVNRFESAVNTGRTPSPTMPNPIPVPAYAGVENAYERYVGPPKTVQQIVQQDIRPGELRVYDTWDAMYLGEKQPLTVWDLWFSDGTYKFEHGMFYRSDLAWQTWMQRRTVLDPNGLYDNLNNGLPVDPATGEPMNVKPIFQEGFIKTYDYYVNHFYSSQFHQNLDLGTQHGADMGTQVGKRVAQQKGLVQAYNEKFRDSSRATFAEAFTTAYSSTFNATYADYNNNPKLSIQLREIVGAIDDGILEPGEQFSVKFLVKNVGGRPSPLNVTVGGNVQEANQQSFQINALASNVYTTAIIGRIDPRLQPRSNARVTLNVNGIVDSLDQTVLRMVQIASARAQLQVNQGSGSVLVVATNTSTVRTPRNVSASLHLNGRVVDTQSAGFINQGDSQQIALHFGSVDPMALIQGRVQLSVSVSLGDTPSDQAAVAVNVGDVNSALVSYFNVLANGDGYIPVGHSNATQLDVVRSTIVGNNNTETLQLAKGPNVYKKNPASTIVGKLAQTFEATSQNQSARDNYDSLARALWPARKNLRNFLFFGGKRKSYEQIVQRLAKSKLK